MQDTTWIVSHTSDLIGRHMEHKARRALLAAGWIDEGAVVAEFGEGTLTVQLNPRSYVLAGLDGLEHVEDSVLYVAGREEL